MSRHAGPCPCVPRRRLNAAEIHLDRIEKSKLEFTSRKEQFTTLLSGLPDAAQASPGAEFAGSVDDGRRAAIAARQRMTNENSRLAQAQETLTAAIDKLRRTSGDFPKISGPVKDRVMHDTPDVLGRNAMGLAAQLRLRASTLEGELAAIAKDQGILADSLAGVVRDSMETLAKAERSSRMGTAPGAWADRKVLRIGFERPDDDVLHAYAERVIDRVIQKGLKPEGMPLLKEAVREAAVTPAPRVWPSALEAAGRIASRPDEHALLEHVARWLRDNPAPVRVPAEERSAELFDDEKALDRYRKTRLFTSGALTLDMLACYDPPLPFASQHVPGSGPVTLLVAENLATYTSFLTAAFLTAARALNEATRPHLHIAWGVGGSFEQSVLSIPLLDPSPRHVRYFGDLDRAGLRIAASAARQAVQVGIPLMLPAIGCYQFLLDGPRHWRRPDDSNRVGQPDYRDACAWLPPALRPRVGELLASGEKVAQEHLGLQALLGDPTLIAGLAS